jgi:hypothetical protein
LNFGEGKYGEMYEQAIAATKLSYDHLAPAKLVAKCFEICRRRQNLSWSHHHEVAHLDDPAEQDRLLDEAEKTAGRRSPSRTAAMAVISAGCRRSWSETVLEVHGADGIVFDPLGRSRDDRSRCGSNNSRIGREICYNSGVKSTTEKHWQMFERQTSSAAAKTITVREAAAERMRRCRARRRAGFRCFTVELHDGEIEALVRRGILRGDERDDEGAVIDALSQYIVALARLAIPERLAQRRDVNPQRSLVNDRIGPGARDQLILADGLAGAFDKRNEDVQGPAAEA